MLDAVARRGLARTGLLGQVSALDEVRGALGELRESAREGATRAVRGVSEALGKAGKGEPSFGRGGRDGVIRMRVERRDASTEATTTFFAAIPGFGGSFSRR